MRLLTLLVIFLGTACSPFRDVPAHFVAINQSDEVVQLIVDGVEAGPTLIPQDSREFKVSVKIPRQTNGISGSYESEVKVSVMFRVIGDGLTREIYCTAGEYITTTVIFEKVAERDARIRCRER